MKINQNDYEDEGDASDEYQNERYKKSNRKYSRITPEVKDKLIFLIVRNNMSIKQAAQSVQINYSSAKFIFNQYRSKNLKCDNAVLQKSEVFVRKLEQNEDSNILLKSTVGGKFEAESIKVFSVQQIYKIFTTSDPIGN